LVSNAIIGAKLRHRRYRDEVFLKVFARLFQKAARIQRRVALVARRNGRNLSLRLGKSNLKIGNAVTNFWGGFSAKKLTGYADNTAIVYSLKTQANF